MPREKVKNIDMQRIGRIVSNAMFMGVPCMAVALWVPVLLGVPIALLVVAVRYVNLRADALKKRILWQNVEKY